LYQFSILGNNTIIYRGVDDFIYSIEDSTRYKILYHLNQDTTEILKKSLIYKDTKTEKNYLIKEYSVSKDSINFRYRLFKLDTSVRNKNIINSSLFLTVDSDEKINFLAFYNDSLYVKMYNPIIPNEIGLYYLDFGFETEIPFNSVKRVKKKIFGVDTGKVSHKINIIETNSIEYRVLNSEEIDIFLSPTDSLPTIEICQNSIKCLLESVNNLIQSKHYSYALSKLFVYDSEDFELLNMNKNFLRDPNNLKTFFDNYHDAYTEFENALWTQSSENSYIFEGNYLNMFIIFAVKIDGKYFLTSKVFK